MSDIRTIRAFIASPGDLAVERAAFQQVLEELNAGFGDALTPVASHSTEAGDWWMLKYTGRRLECESWNDSPT